MLKIQHVSYSLLFIILFAPLDLSNNFICMFSCILCMVMIRCGFFYLLVARCQSDSEDVVEAAEESSDIGIVGDDVQDFGDGKSIKFDTHCCILACSLMLLTLLTVMFVTIQ